MIFTHYDDHVSICFNLRGYEHLRLITRLSSAQDLMSCQRGLFVPATGNGCHAHGYLSGMQARACMA